MCPPPRARSARRGDAMTDVVIVDSGVANLASIASAFRRLGATVVVTGDEGVVRDAPRVRSEEHTSELQSHSDLVCRLLLEKKKEKKETDEASKVQRSQDHT